MSQAGWLSMRETRRAADMAASRNLVAQGIMTEPEYMRELVFDPKTHVYRVNGHIKPHVTEIIPSDYSHVPPDKLERARVRGSNVHRLTELYDLEMRDGTNRIDWAKLATSPLEPYLEAWVKVVAEYEIEFDAYDIERRLYHPIDGYAGTGDRPRAWIKPPNQRRRLATLEIKSIAKMDDAVGLQTAGQQRAENYRARWLGIPETEDRWGIQLKPNGDYKAVQYTDKHHERVFLSYLITLTYEVSLGRKSYAIQGQHHANGNNQARRVYSRSR